MAVRRSGPEARGGRLLLPARGRNHRQLSELAVFQDKLDPDVSYTKIATISTDAVHESNEYRLQVGAGWPFLSDPERKIQKDLEIKECADPDHEPTIPRAHDPAHVRARARTGHARDLQRPFLLGTPSKEELWRDPRKVSRQFPGWDTTAPGLRGNQEEGDQSEHYPYEEGPNYPYETNA